jgi:erythromycin esterase-like protein
MQFFRRIGWILTLAACGPLPALPPGVSEVNGWSTTQSNDDLAPLGDLVGGATYVGLGESEHTSGGFYAAKNRLIRYLIETQGFRVLAMETPRTAAAEDTAPYVATCANPEKAAKGIFNVFVDDNTVSLFEWLCAWNQSHPSDPVSFFGFDEQQPHTDGNILQSFLSTAAPTDGASLMAGIQSCSFDYNSSKPVPNYATCQTGLSTLTSYLATNEEMLTTDSSAESFMLAHLASVSLAAWQDELYFETSDFTKSLEARDAAMATIFQTMHDFYWPGAKTILWAHNLHLARAQPLAAGDGASFVSMGTLLEKNLGDAYQPIALVANRVGINWPGTGFGYLPSASGGSVEAKLSSFGHQALLVDNASAWVQALGELPLDAPQEEKVRPNQQYRGLVFLEDSPPMNSELW